MQSKLLRRFCSLARGVTTRNSPGNIFSHVPHDEATLIPGPKLEPSVRVWSNRDGLYPQAGMFTAIKMGTREFLIQFIEHLPGTLDNTDPQEIKRAVFGRPTPLDEQEGSHMVIFIGSQHFLIRFVRRLHSGDEPLENFHFSPGAPPYSSPENVLILEQDPSSDGPDQRSHRSRSLSPITTGRHSRNYNPLSQEHGQHLHEDSPHNQEGSPLVEVQHQQSQTYPRDNPQKSQPQSSRRGLEYQDQTPPHSHHQQEYRQSRLQFPQESQEEGLRRSTGPRPQGRQEEHMEAEKIKTMSLNATRKAVSGSEPVAEVGRIPYPESTLQYVSRPDQGLNPPHHPDEQCRPTKARLRRPQQQGRQTIEIIYQDAAGKVISPKQAVRDGHIAHSESTSQPISYPSREANAVHRPFPLRYYGAFYPGIIEQSPSSPTQVPLAQNGGGAADNTSGNSPARGRSPSRISLSTINTEGLPGSWGHFSPDTNSPRSTLLSETPSYYISRWLDDMNERRPPPRAAKHSTDPRHPQNQDQGLSHPSSSCYPHDSGAELRSKVAHYQGPVKSNAPHGRRATKPAAHPADPRSHNPHEPSHHHPTVSSLRPPVLPHSSNVLPSPSTIRKRALTPKRAQGLLDALDADIRDKRAGTSHLERSRPAPSGKQAEGVVNSLSPDDYKQAGRARTSQPERPHLASPVWI